MSEINRQTELDILRLLATLAVIAIHAVKITAPFGIAPLVWCVPVFFLISGRFFLDPERKVTTERLFQKNVVHIVTTLFFWSAIFTIYYLLSGSYNGLNFFGVLVEFIHGPYHLWFLYALIGLYLLTPIFRRIAADDKTLIYTLLLFAVVNVTTEYLIYLPGLGNIIDDFASRLGLRMLTGYMGYYLLGYYIWKRKDNIGKRQESAIYILGVVMFVATIVAECKISNDLRDADFVKQYLKPNVIIFSAALYMFFIKRVSQWSFLEKTRCGFMKLTEYSLGVYCVHALLSELIPALWLCNLQVFSSLLQVLILYLLSLICTWLIRKIPYIGKMIT